MGVNAELREGYFEKDYIYVVSKEEPDFYKLGTPIAAFDDETDAQNFVKKFESCGDSLILHIYKLLKNDSDMIPLNIYEIYDEISILDCDNPDENDKINALFNALTEKLRKINLFNNIKLVPNKFVSGFQCNEDTMKRILVQNDYTVDATFNKSILKGDNYKSIRGIFINDELIECHPFYSIIVNKDLNEEDDNIVYISNEAHSYIQTYLDKYDMDVSENPAVLIFK